MRSAIDQMATLQTNLTSARVSGAGAGTSPVKVLIVDDSAVVRQLLSRDLSRDPQIHVVGTAPDPYVARDKIVELNPDVLTLDVEMPRMDGITFLRKLMQYHPMSVLVLSSLTATGTRTAIDALAAGAIEVLCKPGGSFSVESMTAELARLVKLAAKVKPPVQTVSKTAPTRAQAPRAPLSMSETTNKIIALGASTGGVQALTTVLTAFPPNAPGTVVVQHMPPKFTASFAARLDESCQVHVKEAEHGDTVAPGLVLVAPGGKHMVLRRSGSIYQVELNEGPEAHHQRPSVDVLFDSVADYAGANAVGAILTGMGADGASGLLKMRQAGGRTLAQDEASCIVFGMPMEAIKIGAAERVVALDNVAAALNQMAQQCKGSNA
jgi:two-component system, chemotaxis family, protein-glutamate methylesterase/glutaminase